MKMKDKFKPMLAVDASENLDNIKYPKLGSYKLDGIRCLFHPKLGLISRTLKQIPNKQLQERFNFLVKESKRLDRIFDGELFSDSLSFQEISRVVMTKDYDDKTVLKKIQKELRFKDLNSARVYLNNLFSQIKFHCFDTYSEKFSNETFSMKQDIIRSFCNDSFSKSVRQTPLFCAQEANNFMEKSLKSGFEGIILKKPDSLYKFGRSTLKEELMLKVKPFKTFDAMIINVIPATKVNPNAEKKTNELGYSVTSRKKDDRIIIDKAACFKVLYKCNDNYMREVNVSIAASDEEKEKFWKNRTNLIGKMIEYKGMLIGSKNVPRHPVFLRFRRDKDE